MTTPIPQPPAIPLLGNINSLDKELPLRSFELLAKKYGEIYQLNILGEPSPDIETAFMNDVSLNSHDRNSADRCQHPCSSVRSLGRETIHEEANHGTSTSESLVCGALFSKTYSSAKVRNLVANGLFTVCEIIHF